MKTKYKLQIVAAVFMLVVLPMVGALVGNGLFRLVAWLCQCEFDVCSEGDPGGDVGAPRIIHDGRVFWLHRVDRRSEQGRQERRGT